MRVRHDSDQYPRARHTMTDTEQGISHQEECTHGESTTSKCKDRRHKRHTSVAGLGEHNFN
jgi:hypothetical protein